MRDVKPKPTVRDSESRKISPGETGPTANAPATAPAAEVVSAEPAAVAESAPQIVAATAERQADSAGDPWAAFSDAQAALARGVEEIAAEVTLMTRSGIAATADAAVALFGVTTFAEVVEINAALARRGTDAVIEGSAKLSEIGVKLIGEATRPILSRFGVPWSDLSAPG
ncbi:MAG TPA: phasin family protein [Stellaceae bacterium]|nr:phasin family protein [Stellaceae bacterium]